jgi:hypothetical protein
MECIARLQKADLGNDRRSSSLGSASKSLQDGEVLLVNDVQTETGVSLDGMLAATNECIYGTCEAFTGGRVDAQPIDMQAEMAGRSPFGVCHPGSQRRGLRHLPPQSDGGTLRPLLRVPGDSFILRWNARTREPSQETRSGTDPL